MPVMTISLVWRVARDVEGRILVGDLVQAAGDLLLVAARLGLDGQAEHRRREARPRQLRRAGRGGRPCRRCAGPRPWPRPRCRRRWPRARSSAFLPCISNRPPVRDDLPVRALTSGCSARELAREDAEEAQVADELVGERLEDLADELAPTRSAPAATSCRLVAAALGGGALRALHRRQGEVGQARRAAPATPMSFLAEVQKIGMTVPAASALGRAAVSSSALTVAFHQVLLHQRVVALDDGVHQLASGRRPGPPGSRPAPCPAG